MGAEIRLLRSGGSFTYIGVWEYLGDKIGQSIARKRIYAKVPVPVDVVQNTSESLNLFVQANCDYAKISDVKLEIVGGTATVPTIYTPAPSEDYANAYPTYKGLRLAPSDNPADYDWSYTDEYVDYLKNSSVSKTEFNDLASRLTALENKEV